MKAPPPTACPACGSRNVRPRAVPRQVGITAAAATCLLAAAAALTPSWLSRPGGPVGQVLYFVVIGLALAGAVAAAALLAQTRALLFGREACLACGHRWRRSRQRAAP